MANDICLNQVSSEKYWTGKCWISYVFPWKKVTQYINRIFMCKKNPFFAKKILYVWFALTHMVRLNL